MSLIVGITGHRPARIKGREKEIEEWLRGQLADSKDDIELAYSGMASGVDQIFARVAEELGIPLVCCYAFHHKSFHPQQLAIHEKAAEIRYVSDKRSDDVYTIRDRYLVDRCDVMYAVFDGIKAGGVWDAIQYAESLGKEVVYFPWS